MRIDQWFDPSCPFSWITSRWICRVAEQRDLDVSWRSISLLQKNDLSPGGHGYDRARSARDLLRVVEAVRDAGRGDAVGDLYTAMGRRFHHDHRTEVAPRPVLAEVGLDEAFAAAAGDDAWDEVIRASMDEALSLTGPEVGTPILAVGEGDGRIGLFGPVLDRLPPLEESLELWDGFARLASSPSFFELKRGRSGRPELPDLDEVA